MLLHISDPLWNVVTEVFDRDLPSHTLSFQQPVATLADDAHQPALAFNPSLTVLMGHLPHTVGFRRCPQTACVELNILRLQSDGGPGKRAPIDHLCVHIPAGSDARGKPQDQCHQLITSSISELANLSEVNHGINAKGTFFLPFTRKPVSVQDRQPAPPRSRAFHEQPALVCKEVFNRPVLLTKAVYYVCYQCLVHCNFGHPFTPVEPGEE